MPTRRPFFLLWSLVALRQILLWPILLWPILLWPGAAFAHPHVFVEAREDLVFDAEGRISAVRHAWRFDDAFSAFATRGLDANHDGVLSPAELAPLARVNVESLKQYGYFTFFYRSGERLPLALPREYFLTQDKGLLTLYFTLPLPEPLDPAQKPVRLDVFDPEFYVSFTLTDDQPVSLVPATAKGAAAGRVPPNCRTTVKRPAELDAQTAASLAAIPLDEHDLPAELRNISKDLANTILVTCPTAGVAAAAAQSAGPATTLSGSASPFGVGLTEGGPAPSGLFAVAARWQQSFYGRLTAAVRDLKDDSWAALVLVLVSLGYGVAHAVGPGHGKAVISAYLVSTRGTIRRAVLASTLSSLLQAGVAIAVVGIAVVLLDLTSLAITRAAEWVQTLSFAAVTVLGLTLIWRKIVRPLAGAALSSGRLADVRRLWVSEGRTLHEGLPTSLPFMPPERVALAGMPASGVPSRLAGASASRPGFGRGGESPSGPWHMHGPACGCEAAMMPDEGAQSWRGLAGVVLSAGLRPCTGALIVLVFALAQGVFWAGVLSALAMALGTAVTVAAIAVLSLGARGLALRLANRDARMGALLHRGLEAGAALLVFGMGAVLLAGSLAVHLG